MMQVPKDGKIHQRAYSIASSALLKDKFSLLFKLVPGGIASEFVRELKGGEIVDFTGPWGKCRFFDPPCEQAVFLCTGAGLSQHMSFLLTHGPRFPKVRMRMLIGVWNPNEVYYQNELAQLKSMLGDFEYEFVVDQADTNWNGKTGYITNYLESFEIGRRETCVYLCGNPAMIKSAKEKLATVSGFDPKRMVEESFNH